MTLTTQPPPRAVVNDVARLSAALDAEIPRRRSSNLLVGTWNIRACGGLTAKWESAEGDSPVRDWHAVTCLAEVIRRFDVVAVQEVRRATRALLAVLEVLGPRWEVIASDVTEGSAGNGERLSFLYDSSRVRPSGLVGEIVLPPDADGPADQFARTPYVASFHRKHVEFVLATVHVVWGKRPADRLPEVTAFAEWMRTWARRKDDWNQNLLVLGDFNLDRIGDPLFEAFVATGLWPPTELNEVPRTVFDNDGTRHFYDQIAWFSTPTGTSLLRGLEYTHRGGSFDFVPRVFDGLTLHQVSWRMSDHYPLWTEFKVS
jgi:exonuclease III